MPFSVLNSRGHVPSAAPGTARACSRNTAAPSATSARLDRDMVALPAWGFGELTPPAASAAAPAAAPAARVAAAAAAVGRARAPLPGLRVAVHVLRALPLLPGLRRLPLAVVARLPVAIRRLPVDVPVLVGVDVVGALRNAVRLLLGCSGLLRARCHPVAIAGVVVHVVGRELRRAPGARTGLARAADAAHTSDTAHTADAAHATDTSHATHTADPSDTAHAARTSRATGVASVVRRAIAARR